MSLLYSRMVSDLENEGVPLKQLELFSRHAHVLLTLSRRSEMRLSELSQRVGLTERSVRKIVISLEQSGHLTIKKEGRNNTYLVCRETPLPNKLETPLPLRRFVG